MAYITSGITQAVQSAWATSSDSDTQLSVVCISIDSLNAFRRQYGYDLGDQVLAHVKGVALEALSPSELHRTEDDCFLALLTQPLESLLTDLDRFRSRIAASKLRFTVDGQSIAKSITISIGVARKAHTNTSSTLIAECVEAWATARSQGNAISSYSNSDALTRLPSGQPLLDQLAGVLDDASPAGDTVSIIQVDIDGFGSTNVEFGTAACDEMLQTLASNLEHQFGEKATVGRLWSDEFLIILAKTRPEDAAFAAEAVRRAIQEQESPDGPISLSIGVATYPLHAGDAGGLLRKAREARYLSQQDGGGRTRVAEADQMITKTSHFTRIQLKRLSTLARSQDRSEAAVLREGLDAVLALYADSATGLPLLLPKS